MVKELNEKSQVDEKRVSEMNVNVENLNMNVSMQHRTVIGLVEDRKLELLEKSLTSAQSFLKLILPLRHGRKIKYLPIHCFCCLLDKELIDQHTKDIDELRNRPIGGGGDGVDMNQLMNLFACKNPPDNTINRIEALEKQMQDVFANNDKINDLMRRVQSLETRAEKNDRRLDVNDESLADHERRLKALESVPSTPISGDLDTAAILK